MMIGRLECREQESWWIRVRVRRVSCWWNGFYGMLICYLAITGALFRESASVFSHRSSADYLGFSIVNPWTELFLFKKYFINWTSSFFDSLSQICLKISEWWKYRLRSNSFILRIIKYYKIRRTILNHFLIEFQNCICYTVRATFFNRGGLIFRKVRNEYFYIFLIE